MTAFLILYIAAIAFLLVVGAGWTFAEALRALGGVR